MLGPITVRHAVRPARRSLATARVCDLFGLTGDEPDHVVADGLTLDVRPGDVVLVTGPSGSGKSSLLRELGGRLGAVDVNALSLPAVPLVDALPGPIDDRLATLAGCGLGEARLLLRTPAELSDGQRHRFRIAYAMAQCGMENQDPSSIPNSAFRTSCSWTSSPPCSTGRWPGCWRSPCGSWPAGPGSGCWPPPPTTTSPPTSPRTSTCAATATAGSRWSEPTPG